MAVDLRHMLFGFRGRINRAKWWLSLLIIFILLILIGILARAVDAEPVKGLLVLLFLVLFVWISLAATAKRLHDLNLSDAWLVVVIGGPILLVLMLIGIAGIAAGIVVISDRLAEVVFGGYAVLTVVFVYGWLVIAFGFPLVLGFWPGTVGPNRFGPDPLGTPAPAGAPR